MSLKKIIFMAVLNMLLVHCKVEFAGEGKIRVYNDDVTSLSQISYFNGGWYGPSPNYHVDLDFTVQADQSILATMDKPNCKIKGQVDSKDIYELEELVIDAKKELLLLPPPLDGGSELLILSYQEEDSQYEYHLVAGDNSYKKLVIVEEDAKLIREKIESIVLDLESQYPCRQEEGVLKSVDVSQFEIRTNNSDDLAPSSTPVDPTLPVKKAANIVVDRDLEFLFVGGVAYVSGTEKLYSYENTTPKINCAKKFNMQKVSADLSEYAELIQVVRNDYKCMIGLPQVWPQSAVGLKVSLNYIDGRRVTGYDNFCWNSERLVNHEKFMAVVDEFLRKQPATCVTE